ncbi:hypothetical protein CAPTEDRAFT_168725 [Capitella teleta]|uniref:Hepatocellular carcinoma-associated antigen 59 domain-containing protein n=1 Tax=Capitella teleta TaxID=283909 RepID=R7UKQ5_CAPTE|nr:hypothetical protein CAPTEDRAFT_168725 [Capitella teleta]|eukprot:ELU06673.1 hypothetical protein CAPTEDRAFT_168725 [Capitella teleta]
MFKKPKKNFRRKVESSDSEDNSDVEEKSNETLCDRIKEAKELQKLRQRQRGVSAEDLAVAKITPKDSKKKEDPLKLKTGGYIELKTLKKEISKADKEDVEQIGTTFAAETNRRDEDADMLKYVEEELNKRKGITKEFESETLKRKPEDALYELPEHVKALTAKKSKNEDMLSNQMLSGIPEVDLGIEVKIHNIEMTEVAKQKLIEEKRRKKDSGISEFVPTNIAVNFMQHNRFTLHRDEKAVVKKKVVEEPKPEPLRVGDIQRPDTVPSTSEFSRPAASTEKATDDYHYERFKKAVRRYMAYCSTGNCIIHVIMRWIRFFILWTMSHMQKFCFHMTCTICTL